MGNQNVVGSRVQKMNDVYWSLLQYLDNRAQKGWSLGSLSSEMHYLVTY